MVFLIPDSKPMITPTQGDILKADAEALVNTAREQRSNKVLAKQRHPLN
jgi:hypothetical protein